ncbi:MAG: esterase family protein [Firmicutes bacterium]|nr:esterase family protein [Bacillota bacterium]
MKRGIVLQEEYIRHFSHSLGRDMEIMVYGHGGVPVLGFPTQNSKCHNYEDFRMIQELSDFIEEGKIQMFVVDTVDEESWSNEGGDNTWRAARQEQYFHYIVDEVVPLIRERNPLSPAVTGFSMGANHALISFLRRPDLFRGVIALSGVYDTDYFFHGWMDSVLYESSPERFLPNMPADHPYIQLYNERKIILCCGQGPWEEEGIRTLRFLEQVFREKGIHAWCDFWGFDVAHDWPWWYRQMRYFLPYMIKEE